MGNYWFEAAAEKLKLASTLVNLERQVDKRGKEQKRKLNCEKHFMVEDNTLTVLC